MSEYDRNNSEFQYSHAPDFSQMMAGMLQGKPVEAKPSPNGFDPHKLMVQKHKIEKGEIEPNLPEDPKWPVEDVQALEAYCQKMGIIGFSTRQHPRLALAQLKRQVGDMSDIPLENRVPMGYEQVGKPNSHNCNFPYSKVTDSKKSLLNG
jgi:hypothetical protein